MQTEIEKKKSFYLNEKDYMNSYHWNYMVLELVDHIEMKLKSATATTGQGGSKNQWGNFAEFCHDRGLNRRVIRKMIEFSVGQAFESETDLVKHEAFRRLETDDCNFAPITAKADCKVPAAAKDSPIPIAAVDVNFDSLDNLVV